jgi:cell division protein FtsN
MKKLAIAGAVIVLLVGGAVFLLMDNLDAIVKKIIEKAGTAAVETPVTVDRVKISLSEGSAAIGGLAVQNPAGFSNDKAMRLGELMAQVDAQTQVIRKIRVAEPVFLFEEKAGKTNFQVLQDTLAAKKKSSAPSSSDEKADDKEKTEIRIDRIEIEKARVRLVSDLLKEEEQLVLDKLVLKNISGTSDQVAQQILSQLAEKVASSATRRLLKEKVKEKVGEKGGKQVKSLVDSLLGD